MVRLLTPMKYPRLSILPLSNAGAIAASTLLGPRDEAPVPALRRLDAYLVAGPVWALLGQLLLDL